jgi:superoxide reductase
LWGNSVVVQRVVADWRKEMILDNDSVRDAKSVVLFIDEEGAGMPYLGELIQHDDWKKEKHIPVIECPDEVAAGEMFDAVVTLGKEIAHPNTTEHHIEYITLYFKPDGDKYVYQVGQYEFSAHGASVAGANAGPVYTHHGITTSLKITQSGTLHAVAFCNIHGLWEYSKEVKVK